MRFRKEACRPVQIWVQITDARTIRRTGISRLTRRRCILPQPLAAKNIKVKIVDKTIARQINHRRGPLPIACHFAEIKEINITIARQVGLQPAPPIIYKDCALISLAVIVSRGPDDNIRQPITIYITCRCKSPAKSGIDPSTLRVLDGFYGQTGRRAAI